jgi:hypothetical protein
MKKKLWIFSPVIALALLQFVPALADPLPQPARLATSGTDTPTEVATNTPTETSIPSDTPLPTYTATATSTSLASTDTATPTVTGTPTATVLTLTGTPTVGSYARPLLNLTTYSYTASATYAGGAFELTAELENDGQQAAYNLIVTFSSSDIQPQSNGGVAIVSVLDRGDSATLTQDFVVKSSVSSKYCTINVQVDYKDGNGMGYSQQFSISITIYGYGVYATATPTATPIGRPHLVVASYAIDLSTLQPGSTFQLSMNIQNQGAYTAKNVSLTIGGDNSGTGTSTGSYFLPVGSSNVVILGDLAHGQSTTVKQSFIVSSSISAGAYPLNLVFEYQNDLGVNYSESQVITLLVYDVPSIEVGFYEDPATFVVGQKGNLPIQVVNLSSSSVLLGDISISADNATLANSHMFIGTIDGGGIFTMDTDITPQQSGTLTIYVNITYQDNYKNTKAITSTLTINVQSASSAGLQQTPGKQSAAGASSASSSPSGTEASTNAGGQSTLARIWSVVLRVLRGLVGLDSGS